MLYISHIQIYILDIYNEIDNIKLAASRNDYLQLLLEERTTNG